jgi:splicing factor 3B subunit 3
VRKHAEPVDPGANRLLAVPGPADGGPGGVLVCCENFVLYRNPGAGAAAPPELRAVIPRRADLPPERGVLLTAAAVLRQKARFYAFAQSEYGDVYRISLQHAGEAVSELKVRYFDTVPPAAALCVLRRGFLFAAAEFGDHALYQFTGLGDGEAVEASSATLERVGGGAGGGGGEDGEEAGYAPVFFEPRFPPANLEAVDRLESLAPVTALAVANLLGEEAPQVYAACGRGARSTLRCLRPGLAVAELAASALPGAATGVWTLRARLEDAHDALIVVSFAEATLVLGVGETVEAVADSGLAAGVRTLAAARLADASLLQVHPGGLRHVRPDGRVSEWRAPGRRAVTAAAANARQVAVALAGGELVYFELSAQGMLVEAERREAGGDVAALDVAPLEEGRARARVLAVAGFDSALRLLSLDPGEGLRPLATQALAANAESVLLLDAPDGGLLLQAGLANGVLVRAEVDRVTGQLAGTRTRFLGVRAPLLARVAARGAPAALALSSRPWLAYAEGGRLAQAPLSHGPLDFAAPFASEQCPEGFVAVAGATLRVLAVERLGGGAFNAASLRLRYTPRALAVHPDARVLLVAEADAGAVSLAGRAALAAAAAAAGGGAMELAAPPPPAPDAPGPEGDADASARDDALGAPRAAAPGAWASCLRVVDPATFATTQTLELDGDEAALSLAVATFESAPEAGALVCVGVARALRFGPRADAGGAVRVYRLAPDGRALELLHSTEVGGVPRALCAFRGMLLVGVGDAVRLYALGKKRLLRKCEARGLPSEAATLHASGPRVYVGDARESFFFMKYKKSENKLYVFADDAAPRHVLAAANLDYDSMVRAGVWI